MVTDYEYFPSRKNFISQKKMYNRCTNYYGGREMKPRLVPVYFESAKRDEFNEQLNILKQLLAEEVELLEPVALGPKIPEAEAVLFPQLVGEAYKKIDILKKIRLPFLAITSEFGTVAMWDWEIVSYLKSKGCQTHAPTSIEWTKKICRILGVKREIGQTKFLVFQDNPGEGMQADIFKRFYWWEEQCIDLMREKFGITLVKKSFKQFGAQAKQIPDKEAEAVWKNWNLKTEKVSDRALTGAIKIYIAVKREIEKDSNIRGVGINCLNESFYSDTTPCLAWNMLFEEKGILWACEADTMTLLTKYLIHRSLAVPIMMSNIYPFLMGMAALKHERIEGFPEVDRPENHVLIAHCGYLGVLPESFSTEWQLQPKVLAIVDDNATAIDARLPTGDLTMAKLDPTMSKLLVVEGSLVDYVQYPGSDCLNGAVVRVPNGHKLVDKLYSHHVLLMTGHRGVELDSMARVFDLQIDEV
jgi:hypothetical protein